ncbi:ABC transporter ATP-binding protein [Chitinibacter bivalviorum]|uniref:ABC transporter ATP-binding protein n=1 Tax=Chitinibacter bivalviorum TaxID=2739434 RepID=A0A7H9BGW3_9NEIS|nr:ABC transporter ATP-binding protein [Chitinibacter bivalviorum]QLG87448.1 ABC transporter ATP-binding protein [Chitinibacter bivalviorum]
MSLLQAQNLSLKQGDRELICNLNLQISAGEAWIVLGENGCGKSTLLSSLAGWFKPSAGQVLLGGVPMQQVAPLQRAKQLAWQTQQDECPFPLTVLEKTLTGRHPHLSRWEWESAADLALAQQQLARLDLQGFAERDLASLSGGERRRVSLATALTQQAPLMLLDEPLSQLDLRHQQQALAVLREELAAGRSIVMVSHDPNHAAQLATHALLLFGDGTWSAGVLVETLNTKLLSRLYHHPVSAIEQNGSSWFVPMR